MRKPILNVAAGITNLAADSLRSGPSRYGCGEIGVMKEVAMKLRSIAVFSLLLLLVAGCGGQFKYGDTTYSSREAAVQAVRTDIDAWVAGVTPLSERLGGRALVVVPTRTLIRAHGVQGGGPLTGEDAAQYVVDTIELGLLGSVEGVRKGAVFDDVTLLRNDNPEDALFDTYDYKLWLFAGGPTTWQWYLSRSGMTERETVSADAGLEGTARVASFNQSIVRAGERLGAKPSLASSDRRRSTTLSEQFRRLKRMEEEGLVTPEQAEAKRQKLLEEL